MTIFIHKPLELVKPSFDSELTDLVIDLDHLRRKRIGGSTHPAVFFQLKSIFQTLESIGSARIEGNNTTISEFIETKLEASEVVNEQIQEIRNIEDCIEYIDSNGENIVIGRHFISDLHKMVTKDLTPPPEGEGARNPGNFRNHSVGIVGSTHEPPKSLQQIESYMDELFSFLNREDAPKYDLLKMALAHHRFMWIHPFGNGNGRVGRLLTYALLVKAGFNVAIILNPTAVFCNNRNEYYKKLSIADNYTDNDLIIWSEYVLGGLKKEIDKIDRLLDYEHLKECILIPSLEHSKERTYINNNEYKILKVVIEKQRIKNADIQEIFKGKHSVSISRYISKLRDKKMLVPERDNTRMYHLSFTNNILIRSVIKILEKEGFAPSRVE